MARMPERPSLGFDILLRPMHGGIGTAASQGRPLRPPLTLQLEATMDFNEIGTGSTIYLPVKVPGALFISVVRVPIEAMVN